MTSICLAASPRWLAWPLLAVLLGATTNAVAAPQGADDGTPSDSADSDEPAQPAEPAPQPPAPQPPAPAELTPEQRAALKAELKAEIVAELRREQQAQSAAEQAAERARQKPPAKEKPADSGLAPPDQARTLGAHPVNNGKNAYKPGSGLHLESDDGEFALATRLRGQLRHQLDFGSVDPAISQVLQLRRARLQFKGHAFSKHNKFKVELAFSPRDLSVKNGVAHNTPLLTWYLELDYLRDMTLRAGQYKIPYSRQRVVSSGDLQLVDRALANGEFNHDRDIGFDLRSKDVAGLGGYLRYYAGVYMGEGRDFGDKNATTDFKLHYLGRVEVLPLGEFKDDYEEADMLRHATPKLSLGAAYAFHHESQGLRGVLGTVASDEGTTNYHSATADYAFKYAGFSTTAEFHWRSGKRNPGDATIEDPNDPTMTIAAPVEAARSGVGWFFQAGYLFPGIPFEVAARYSGIRGIGDIDPGTLSNADGFTSLGTQDEVGAGVSYYFAGHSLKLQADYFHLWSEGAFSDGDNAIRTQLQAAL